MTVGTVVIESMGNGAVRYTNTSTLDDEVVIETGDVSRYDTFMVMSATGAVDIYVALATGVYSTAALSLQDFGAIVADPVLVTVAGRMYGFRGKFHKIKVVQNGDTDVAVTLMCGTLGVS